MNFPTVNTRLGRVIVLFILTHSGYLSADAEEEWQRGFNIQMPATSRSITLAKGIDPKRWAQQQGLKDFRIENLAGRGSILNLPMEERDWQRRMPQLCNAGGVQACENTQCQQIQLGGRVRQGPGIQSFRPRLRLVKKAPDISQLLNPAAGNNAYCKTDNSDYGSPVPVLNRPPKAANYQLASGQLPQDPQCWDLVVESACSKSVTPLESLVPARDIKRVLVLLPAAKSGAVQAVATLYGFRVIRRTEMKSLNEVLVVFEIGGQGTIDTVLPRLLSDSSISGAYPEHYFGTSAQYADPYAALAYGPRKIGAPRLHPSTTGKDNLVAVIDTGIDNKHPELADAIAGFHDLTGSGWSADLHGTAIAGIIAAKANNGLGSYGVAPGVKILGLKACQPKLAGKLAARCRTSALVEALDLAIQNNAKIINMSLGGPPDKLVARYVQAARQRGSLVVAAAGNGGPHAKPAFPAALAEAIAVTAVDAIDNRYSQANIGDFIQLAAPGVDIVSVSPGLDYPVLSGTSMAAAHVSGAAALLLGLAPSASPVELTRSLINQASDLGQPGPDSLFGQGMLNSCKSAEAITGNGEVCTHE